MALATAGGDDGAESEDVRRSCPVGMPMIAAHAFLGGPGGGDGRFESVTAHRAEPFARWGVLSR